MGALLARRCESHSDHGPTPLSGGERAPALWLPGIPSALLLTVVSMKPHLKAHRAACAIDEALRETRRLSAELRLRSPDSSAAIVLEGIKLNLEEVQRDFQAIAPLLLDYLKAEIYEEAVSA